MPKTKPDIRFVVSTSEPSWSGERNLQLEAHLVVVTDEGVRYPSFGWSDTTGAGDYEGLKVTAHVYNTDSDLTYSDWIYSQVPQVYDVYSIDARRAESLARMLKRLQTKLFRLDEQLGATRNLTDYLARLALACGATTTRCFGVRTKPGTTWDELALRWMDINGLQMHLTDAVNDWKKR
jgi:hypothetical protein